MKICIVGLGSIAIRHVKNLRDILGENITIDLLRSGKGKALPLELLPKINNIYYSIDDLACIYDALFITNPTKFHYYTLKECEKRANSFFIEKPVFETGEESIEKLGLDQYKTYYVACPLRYTKVIRYLKRNIDVSNVYSVRCICSSYLPEWRKNIDYRSTYSAHKELGGGVSIDLIHEWDYLCYLFGKPQKIYSLMGKKSNLEINSEDIAVYIAEYDDKIIELHLDYFGRVPTRKIELICKENTIVADLIDHRITFQRENKFIDFDEDRDSYQKKELLHFFDIVSRKCMNDNTIEQACEVLRMARGIII